MRRFLAVLHARNMEFLRDRASLGWNILVPVFLVFGLGLIFGGPERPEFKVGVVQAGATVDAGQHPFLATRHVQFLALADRDAGIAKVARHRLHMLVDLGDPARYWVNPDSPRGYVLERMLLGAGGAALARAEVPGASARYIDWLLPGILGMNIMFSCLFGVGYVVVRYRKNGFLKRLHATPLRAFEFIAAQLASRLLLIMVITVAVYAGTDWVVGFRMEGSHLTLLAVATLGAVAMIALGLVVAARVDSEELASGLLNLISWPMMLLSGVWFSLEGSHPLIQRAAEALPLTHLLEAARAVMLDGAGFADVAGHMAALLLMSVVLLGLGAGLFRWRAR